MREPYGSLVEFISSYNCGGGFGGIDGRGFRISKRNHGSTGKIMVRSYGGGRQISGIAGKFLRELNQSQVKDQHVQRNHFKNRKSFSGARKYY